MILYGVSTFGVILEKTKQKKTPTHDMVSGNSMGFYEQLMI
jgi:hypothetical protein